MITEDAAKKGLINDQLASQLESLSAQVEANVERGKNALAEWSATLRDSSARTAHAAEQLVRERPWQVIGALAVLGMVLGALCARSRTTRLSRFQ